MLFEDLWQDRSRDHLDMYTTCTAPARTTPRSSC